MLEKKYPKPKNQPTQNDLKAFLFLVWNKINKIDSDIKFKKKRLYGGRLNEDMIPNKTINTKNIKL